MNPSSKSQQSTSKPTFPGRVHSVVFFLVAGLIIEACLIGLALNGNVRESGSKVILAVSIFLVAFIVYLFPAIQLIRKGSGPSLRIIIFFALLFRITLLPSFLNLSDDLERYLWDAKVMRGGVNPFRYAPGADELDQFRSPGDLPVNHPEIPTIYPPLSQAYFLAVHFLGDGEKGMRMAAALLDMGVILALISLLRATGKSPCLSLLYAWHPLPVVEFAGNGHHDVLGILFLILTLLAVVQRRQLAASGLMALSVLAKLWPIVLIPIIFLGRTFRTASPPASENNNPSFAGRLALAIVVFSLICLAGYMPFISVGAKLFDGLRTYSREWHFNSVFFSTWFEWTGDRNTPKVIALAVVALMSFGFALFGRDAIKGCFYTLGAFFLLSPTLHPWYLTWIIPFLCFRMSAAWLVLSGTVGLAYLVLFNYVISGVWQESNLVLLAEYLPFLAAWIVSLWHRGKPPGTAGS